MSYTKVITTKNLTGTIRLMPAKDNNEYALYLQRTQETVFEILQDVGPEAVQKGIAMYLESLMATEASPALREAILTTAESVKNFYSFGEELATEWLAGKPLSSLEGFRNPAILSGAREYIAKNAPRAIMAFDAEAAQ